MECYFSHNKEWTNAFTSNVDGPGDAHTKWRESGGQKAHDVTPRWDVKVHTEDLIYKHKDSQTLIPKPPLGKSTLLQHTIHIKFKKKRDGKKERERRQQCYLRPGYPGMQSPSWSLSSLFPGRSGVELRKWGRCAYKGAPSPGPLWMGPQSPDPGGAPRELSQA